MDLGGLGAKDGPPGVCFWPVPDVALYLVPWLVLGLLLVLPKANRRLAAWWVLAALLCAQGLLLGLRSQLGFVGAGALDILQQAFDALSMGIAAAWLVCPLFGLGLRIAAFLAVVVAGGCAALLAFAVRADWSASPPENITGLFLVFLAVLWSALAISLAGRFCRGKLRATPFSLWVLGLVVVEWSLTAAPLSLVRMLAGGGLPLSAVAVAVCGLALVHFLVLLPFLLLSFIHPFHRERLARISGSSGS